MKTLALLSLLSLSVLAHAQEREWIPYKKLVEKSSVEKYYAMPAAERDKVNLYLRLIPENKNIKPGDLKLTVLHNGERTAIPVSPEGRFTLVPNQKWISENAMTLLSVPKEEKAGFFYDATVPLGDGTQWPYNSVMGGVPQANNVVKAIAGAMSMFAPSMKVVIFKFSKPATLRIEAKDGAKVYSTDARNRIKLKPESVWVKENPLMVASEKPLEAELDTE
ncbi:hypothetical protein ACLB1G_20175 [Oxalobacteraceae bacterium A2-2]